MSYDPDEMMLELFRAEVESHSDSLANALLKLEQSPEDTGVLDGMMRAAHSIKGAARIVRVDAAVDVAHVMEDCFVAAQRGELVLESSGIDVLLKSVDLLVRISDASKAPNVDWTVFDSSIKSTVAQLRCVLNKQPLAASGPVSNVEVKQEPISSPTKIETPKPEPKSEPMPAPLTTNSVTPSAPSASPLASPIANASPRTLILPKILGTENAESFRLQLIKLLDHQANVSLDLSNLQDLDALGLAWLHSAYQFANSKTKPIAFRNAAPNIAKLLDLVGLPHSRDS